MEQPAQRRTKSEAVHNVLPGYEKNQFIAGWSSPVARQAHNLKVVGSNPTPATSNIKDLARNG